MPTEIFLRSVQPLEAVVCRPALWDEAPGSLLRGLRSSEGGGGLGRKSSSTLGSMLLPTGSLAGTRPKAHSIPEGREWLREAGWAVGVVGKGDPQWR